MNRGLEELIKILVELREFYDSLVNPFVLVISFHIKKSKNIAAEANINPLKGKLFRNVDQLNNSQIINTQEITGKNTVQKEKIESDQSAVGFPISQVFNSINLYKFLSEISGDKARDVLNALNEAKFIDDQLYRSLAGKFVEKKSNKSYKMLGLVLSIYLLRSGITERAAPILYNALLRCYLKEGRWIE